MPRLDGTGPRGEGSRTGRKQGNCTTEKTIEEQKTDINLQQKKEQPIGRKQRRVSNFSRVDR